MKEVERLSIGGYAFTVEQDAATLLRDYIASLEKHYLPQADGKEIMDGIEERLAELLSERGHEVIDRSDVESATAVLGRPEAIDREMPEEEGVPAVDAKEARQRRPLYRDMENHKMAGVCAGLAAWSGVSVAAFRLLFVVLTVLPVILHSDWCWSAPLAYVILWVCVPAARTVQEKYRQRGESLHVDDIRQTIRSGLGEMEAAAVAVGRAPIWNSLLRVVCVIVGLFLLVIGASGLILGAFVLLHPQALGVDRLVTEWLAQVSYGAPFMAQAAANVWIQGLLLLVFFLPMLGMLYAGLQLVFNFRQPKWHPGTVIFILWLVALLVLAALFIILIVSGQSSGECWL
jgi:phage shock protein PspC (stress-responsive transcriptional regulator)